MLGRMLEEDRENEPSAIGGLALASRDASECTRRHSGHRHSFVSPTCVDPRAFEIEHVAKPESNNAHL